MKESRSRHLRTSSGQRIASSNESPVILGVVGNVPKKGFNSGFGTIVIALFVGNSLQARPL